jgi:hypothetical protein
MNIKINLLLVMLITLTACAADRPVLMKIGKAKNLTGEATASLLEDGKFKVENAEKLSCSGKYSAADRSLLIMNVHCSDDRFGKVVIVRDEEGDNGRGNGRLSDGSKFSLIFGDGAK